MSSFSTRILCNISNISYIRCPAFPKHWDLGHLPAPQKSEAFWGMLFTMNVPSYHKVRPKYRVSVPRSLQILNCSLPNVLLLQKEHNIESLLQEILLPKQTPQYLPSLCYKWISKGVFISKSLKERSEHEFDDGLN